MRIIKEFSDYKTKKIRSELFELCFDYFEFDFSGYMSDYEKKNLEKIKNLIKTKIKKHINMIDYEIKGNARTSGSPLYVLDSLALSIMNISEIKISERIKVKVKKVSSGLFSDDKKISKLANELYDYTQKNSKKYK